MGARRGVGGIYEEVVVVFWRRGGGVAICFWIPFYVLLVRQRVFVSYSVLVLDTFLFLTYLLGNVFFVSAPPLLPLRRRGFVDNRNCFISVDGYKRNRLTVLSHCNLVLYPGRPCEQPVLIDTDSFFL